MRGLRSVGGGPHRAARHRDRCRAAAGLPRLDDARAVGVHLDDGPVLAAGDQTAPSPTATAVGSLPRRRSRSPRCARGRCATGCRLAVDDPHRALADGHRARAAADRDRLHDAAGARLDPGHRARLLARHPQRAGAGRDRARVRTHRRSASDAAAARSICRIAVNARRDPHAPNVTASARGALPTSNGCTTLWCRDRPAAHCGSRCRPPTATRHRTRAPRARRRPESAPPRCAAVNARDGAVGRVGDPHRATALCRGARAGPTGYLLRDRPLSGSIRPT